MSNVSRFRLFWSHGSICHKPIFLFRRSDADLIDIYILSAALIISTRTAESIKSFFFFFFFFFNLFYSDCTRQDKRETIPKNKLEYDGIIFFFLFR